MKRSAPMRRTALRRRNPERKAAALTRDFGEQAARCRAAPCCVCAHLGRPQRGPSVPHHDPSRGAGGTDADTMPLCNDDHAAVHQEGRKSFWRRVGLDPMAMTAAMRSKQPTTDTDDGVPY